MLVNGVYVSLGENKILENLINSLQENPSYNSISVHSQKALNPYDIYQGKGEWRCYTAEISSIHKRELSFRLIEAELKYSISV